MDEASLFQKMRCYMNQSKQLGLNLASLFQSIHKMCHCSPQVDPFTDDCVEAGMEEYFGKLIRRTDLLESAPWWVYLPLIQTQPSRVIMDPCMLFPWSNPRLIFSGLKGIQCG